MLDIVCLGELLVDFVALEPRKLIHEGPRFQPAAGGAPANVAAGAAKLGLKSGFIGKVGEDSFGQFLKTTLQADGVNTEYLIEDPRIRTTLAFVAIGEEGERDFVFYRDPGADTQLTPDELNQTYFDGAKVFHFGSISLSQEPVRQATLEALAMAKRAGLVISYDPNYRDTLWPSQEKAVEQMQLGMGFADVAKVSEDELLLITATVDSDAAASALLAQQPNLQCLLVSEGAGGCTAFTRQGSIHVPGFAVEAIDTTGAGDAFVAGFLASVLKRGLDLVSTEPPERLRDSLIFANAAAAMSTESSGAIPSFKTDSEVRSWLDGQSVPGR